MKLPKNIQILIVDFLVTESARGSLLTMSIENSHTQTNINASSNHYLAKKEAFSHHLAHRTGILTDQDLLYTPTSPLRAHNLSPFTKYDLFTFLQNFKMLPPSYKQCRLLTHFQLLLQINYWAFAYN